MQVFSTAQQILANTKLSDIATQLLNNPAFQDGAQKLIKDKPSLLPLMVQALVELTKNNPDEESIMKSVFECGGLCSAFVENGLNISQECSFMESITRPALHCPFYKDNRVFYLSYDAKKEYPIFNGWEVYQISMWVFPLKNRKLKQHKMLSPMAKYIASFWEGVSAVRLGDLLPPYHPVLMIQLRYSHLVRWIALDCGREGVGMVSAPGSVTDFDPPIQELLKEEAENAKWVPKIFGFKPDKISLYHFLDYALSHSSPINLKWHLAKHKEDIIGGLTSYCNTTCWGFVQGALYVTNPTYTLNPLKIVQQLWPEKS